MTDEQMIAEIEAAYMAWKNAPNNAPVICKAWDRWVERVQSDLPRLLALAKAGMRAKANENCLILTCAAEAATSRCINPDPEVAEAILQCMGWDWSQPDWMTAWQDLNERDKRVLTECELHPEAAAAARAAEQESGDE